MNTHGSNTTSHGKPTFSAFAGDHARYIDRIKDYELDFAGTASKADELEVIEVNQETESGEESGCITEASIFLNTHYCEIHDRPDYQYALRSLGQCFAASSEIVFQAAVSNASPPSQVEAYDAVDFSEDTADYMAESALQVSDDEIEACGYMAWISR